MYKGEKRERWCYSVNESERRLDNKSNVWKRVSGNGKRGLKIGRDNSKEDWRNPIHWDCHAPQADLDELHHCCADIYIIRT